MRSRSFVLASFFLVALASGACGGTSDDAARAPDPTTGPPVEIPPVRGEVKVGFVATLDGEKPATRVQWGEPFYVVVEGLVPREEITLRSTSDLRDGQYRAEATYAADEKGRIDTSMSPALRGSYTGVDADGLVWSQKTTKEAIAGLEPYALRIDVLAPTGEALANASLTRWYVAKDVVRTAVGDDGLVGAFYARAGASKLPVVVTFGGSEGGIESGESAAMYWASRGYAALGLAYFAERGLPKYLTEVPLEYFEKAFAWLDSRPEVDATKLAVMGGSRGGELALLLGATFPRVSAVVAEVPSGVSWGAPLTLTTETASWTFGGEKIPWVPYGNEDPSEWTSADGEKALSYTPVFRAAMKKAAPAVVESATIRVEKTNGPVLVLAAQDDQVWPSCDLGKIAMDRLTAKGHAGRFPADTFVCYPDSGHGGTGIPGIPTSLMTASVHPITGELLAMGGTPAGIARSQRDSFRRIDTFLKDALRR